MTDEMVRYYARRAGEYERVYAQPRWRADLAVLRARIVRLFDGRRVFEVACGTGYWTQELARVATAVLATDTNEETLAVARARSWPEGGVTFARRDAYWAADGAAAHDAGLAALWLSHVDRARMTEFLAAFHSHLLPGARVLMFDERDTPDRTIRTSRVDAAGNRYEPRRLASGERFEIIKNFYDEGQLRRLVAAHAHDVEVEALACFWTLTYTTTA